MLGLHANLDRSRMQTACTAAKGTQIADGRIASSGVMGALGATDEEIAEQETREFHEKALASFRSDRMD